MEIPNVAKGWQSEALEARIADAALNLANHQDRLLRSLAWQRLLFLHRQRTAEQIQELERQRGLS